MVIYYGSNLVQELRLLAGKINKRLWIAVPYLGSPKALRQILGNKWFDNPSVSVRLLTDTSDMTCLDTESIQHFHNRGEIKSLLGLHAKLYILDDKCLLTSANLTNTAFSKRYEIGVLLTDLDAQFAIDAFNQWWNLARNFNPEELNTIYNSISHSREDKGIAFPLLWQLPDDPGTFVKNLKKKFLNYYRLIDDYNDFSKKYSNIQRLWPNYPLNCEVDGLFNYLYHEAPNRPSYEFAKKKGRDLTTEVQLNEIKKWAIEYRNWNENVKRTEKGEDDVEWRVRNSDCIKDLLSPSKIMTLSVSEIKVALNCTNSIKSDARNLALIFKFNKLHDIRIALNNLVNGDGQLAARLHFCNQIKNLGIGAMSEIVGLAFPEKYPMLNLNSKSGLRFFGYKITI